MGAGITLGVYCFLGCFITVDKKIYGKGSVVLIIGLKTRNYVKKLII